MQMDVELLQERARILQQIRLFFIERGYLELDTPALSPALIPETCLEVFKTEYIKPGGKNMPQTLYLVPSPEVYIKRIIARHKIDVFQLSKCYRNGESCGRIHSPEFTMLEYYTMHADYTDSMRITEDLFDFLLSEKNGKNTARQNNGAALSESGGRRLAGGMQGEMKMQEPEKNGSRAEVWEFLRPPFIRLRMDDAFERYAGFRLSDIGIVHDGEAHSVAKASSAAARFLAQRARLLGICECAENPFDTWAVDDLYELIFVHAVEPRLPKDKPVFLVDYPAFVPCLAKDTPASCGFASLWKERWELYVRGIELANCYTEEREAQKVRAYFEAEGRLKEKNALVPHKTDSEYWKVFADFPPCSGVALGADRLIALLCGCTGIEPVLPFPLEL